MNRSSWSLYSALLLYNKRVNGFMKGLKAESTSFTLTPSYLAIFNRDFQMKFTPNIYLTVDGYFKRQWFCVPFSQ